MSLNRRTALGALWLFCSACTQFPSIADNVCGNGVVELDNREDCDTFDPFPGSKCREKGAENECHLDCSVDEHGVQHLCHPGWGCDEDSICRPPSGRFAETGSWDDVGAWTLSAGDFDGDGRQDVMSSESLDASGSTRLRFNYFDVRGALETRLFPKAVRSPWLDQISPSDARSDIAFTTDSLGVMFGRRDHTWVPEVFSSYRRPNALVRLVGVHDREVQGFAAFTNLITYGTETAFYVGDPDSGILKPRLAVAGSIAHLAGELVSGNIFEETKHSPCLEPVFAMQRATYFSVVDTCDTDGIEVVWRPEFLLTEIALSPPVGIDAGPQIVDLNGDGFLDVLLGAGGQPYVSYGDGSTLSTAIPYRDHADDPAFPKGTPLAVADITRDNKPDFVYPDRLLVSRTAYEGATPEYRAIGNGKTTPWTVAKIADFNGNGFPDVIAGSNGSLNLDFFYGIGTEDFSSSAVSTSAPVQFLSAGDIDGDLITDLALSETPLDGETTGTLKVVFGLTSTPLARPPATPQTVGKIAGIEALSSYHFGGRDNLSVCSSEVLESTQNGALTLLAGGPDRVPFAALTLTEFSSSNESVENAGAFAVVSGRFSSPDQTDLLALALFEPQIRPRIDLWWVPAITEPGAAPSRLSTPLDPRLNPVTFLSGHEFSADVASAAANFDANDGDEAIFAMPADGGKHCGLVLIGAHPGGTFGSHVREPVIIDEPCADPQIAALTIDEHHAANLVLLTGRSSANDRHLYVLQNDGLGEFSAQNMQQVSDPNDSPQAFTLLPRQQEQGGLAYITKDAVRIVRSSNWREFAAPDSLPDQLPVDNGTGIVAADVNGDHLYDLVFSEAGRLRVLKAGLLPP